MKLLALETSSDACSAALAMGDDIIERFEIAPRGHSQMILPMIDELLTEAGITINQVDALAFGRGPGSFTGVRIAVGVAQGIAFGAELPVVPVSSLAALAQGAEADRILVAVDARMHEVYWARYIRNAQGIVECQGKEQVSPPDEVVIADNEFWFGLGSGWGAYVTELNARCNVHIEGIDADALPHARHVARLGMVGFNAGEAVNAEQALPVYLRDEVAWKKLSDSTPA